MANDKKSASKADAPSTDEGTPIEEVDTRPVRPCGAKGRSWPVARSYYHPQLNAVVDVLEVTKTVRGNNGRPDREITLEKHTLCRDERIQAKYKRPEVKVEVPTIIDVDDTEEVTQ